MSAGDPPAQQYFLRAHLRCKIAAIGLPPNGVEVLSIAAKKHARRAVDVNPPVTVRARPARVAAGAHQGRYRPIDIDRSPFMIGFRRVNGAFKVHGTLKVRFDTETIMQTGFTVRSVPDSLTVAARL